jgi:hypothetical protein
MEGRRIGIAAGLGLLNIALAVSLFQPTAASASPPTQGACPNKGCVLDRCTSYAGYICIEEGGICAGGKCGKT